MNHLINWQQELLSYSEPHKRTILQRFFKTGKGEYAEGDVMECIRVPHVRAVSRKYYSASREVLRQMLYSDIHEFRLAALLALVERYRKYCKDLGEREEIISFYRAHLERANNWDLIDLSAPYIYGLELLHNRAFESVLIDEYSSGNLWRQRASVVSALTPVRKGNLDYALRICEMSICHTHSLMQKATGWVLREVGKKDKKLLEHFLTEYICTISATTLSYAIERFSVEERVQWRERRKQALQSNI